MLIGDAACVLASWGWVPSACTLPTVVQPLRLAEFDLVFRTVVQKVTRARRTFLELVIAADGEVAARDLAERETAYCAFFQFEVAPQPTEVW